MMKRGRVLGAAVAVGAAAVLLGGCGPIESTAVIGEAEVEIAGARAADAETKATYEFVSAELYLEKAREERGYADYQAAVDYARKAAELAREARAKAQSKMREGAAPPPPPDDELVPFERSEENGPAPVIQELDPE